MYKKHISCAENTPTAHILNYLAVDVNSQHPYLLGFDSNLVPNLNILVFQPYPEEDSKYSEKSGRFACNSASSLGNTLNIRELHFDWSYFLQDTAGFTANSEYINYSPDSERKTRIIGKSYIFVFRVHYRYRIHRLFARFGKRKTRIIGKIVKRSSEMAKFAIPAQESSEKSEKSL